MPALDAGPSELSSRRSSRSWRAGLIATGIAAALLLAAEVAYVAVGKASADSQIGDADGAIKSALARQSDEQDAFANIGTDFQWVGRTSMTPDQTGPLADQFVLKWKVEAKTLSEDDGALASKDRALASQQWLTLPSFRRIGSERARIAHARRALAALSSAAADLNQDGKFLEAYQVVWSDFYKLANALSAKDAPGITSGISNLGMHAAAALPLAMAPGLPPEFQKLVSGIAKFAKDLRSIELGALTATDAQNTIRADASTLDAISFESTASEMDGFYQPLLATYKSESRAASG